MQNNPNRIYHRKHVIVTGSQQYKGYRGIIKDTNLQGEAIVELAIHPPKVVKLKLDTLHLWYVPHVFLYVGCFTNMCGL